MYVYICIHLHTIPHISGCWHLYVINQKTKCMTNHFSVSYPLSPLLPTLPSTPADNVGETYQCQGRQHAHSDRGWHTQSHTWGRRRTGSTWRAWVHSCAGPATARFVRRSREETPCDQPPAGESEGQCYHFSYQSSLLLLLLSLSSSSSLWPMGGSKYDSDFHCHSLLHFITSALLLLS